ncbi:hypothetical protein DIE14_23085 [Burkholderia sp. Bp9017]|nr:hypothetical protein DIE14_23085 [Burkholderia sp. Bp9017]RQZ31984.1 hypothetical protein DIE13_22955 [Burkholderia sp. Bp9016]
MGITTLLGLLQRARKFLLEIRLSRDYTGLIAETTAIRFGDLNLHTADSRLARFFFVRTSLHAFKINGRAWTGRPSGLPVSVCAGSPTPLSARPPRLATGGGPPTHTRRSHHASAST